MKKRFVLCHNNKHPILTDFRVNLTPGKLYVCDNYDWCSHLIIVYPYSSPLFVLVAKQNPKYLHIGLINTLNRDRCKRFLLISWFIR